jgi:sugar/nucleoside kinase (ribokinase family)
MQAYDIIVFGEYFCDLIVTGLTEIPRLGADIFGTSMGIVTGGSFNTVRSLHRLGLRVGWAADFGSDLFSQNALDEIRQEGVDTHLFRHHDRPVRSFSLAFSCGNERGFISYIDPVEKYPREPLVYTQRPPCVFLCGLEYGPEIPALAGAVHEVGGLLGMDSQSTRATLKTPGVVEALQAVDLFMPNSEEAMSITGTRCPDEAAALLACYTPLVVIKQGGEGVLAQSGERVLTAPAIPVTVLDTTGAGDSFNAGFLYSHLRGDPLEVSLAYGNICGGISTTGYGASAVPTAEEAEAYYRKYFHP